MCIIRWFCTAGGETPPADLHGLLTCRLESVLAPVTVETPARTGLPIREQLNLPAATGASLLTGPHCICIPPVQPHQLQVKTGNTANRYRNTEPRFPTRLDPQNRAFRMRKHLPERQSFSEHCIRSKPLLPRRPIPVPIGERKSCVQEALLNQPRLPKQSDPKPPEPALHQMLHHFE